MKLKVTIAGIGILTLAVTQIASLTKQPALPVAQRQAVLLEAGVLARQVKKIGMKRTIREQARTEFWLRPSKRQNGSHPRLEPPSQHYLKRDAFL